MSLLLKWVMTLVGTTYRNMKSRQSLQNYIHDEDKEVREETIFLIFRWNIVLHELYQADEIVTEIEEWKQKSSRRLCQKL